MIGDGAGELKNGMWWQGRKKRLMDTLLIFR